MCVDDANATGTGAALECGTFVRVSLRVDERADIVELAMFRTNGCGYMIAAADVLAEMLRGRKLTELGGLKTDSLVSEIRDRLARFPSRREHCAEAAIDAVRSALANYRDHRLEEFQGEKALICTCFGISEETIANLIAENNLTDVTEVAAMSRAGSGCGACQMLIREMLDVTDPA